MWQRKTEKEIAKDTNLSGRDLIFSFFVSGIATAFSLIWMQSLAFGIFCFAIFFLLSCVGTLKFNDPIFFVGWLFGSASPSNISDICSQCHKTVIRSDKKKCECGGDFEPIEKWKWIENKVEK